MVRRAVPLAIRSAHAVRWRGVRAAVPIRRRPEDDRAVETSGEQLPPIVGEIDRGNFLRVTFESQQFASFP